MLFVKFSKVVNCGKKIIWNFYEIDYVLGRKGRFIRFKGLRLGRLYFFVRR